MEPIRFVNVKRRRNFRYGTIVVFLLGLGVISACETQRERVSRHEDRLLAAGFIERPADTPERQAMLNRLPPQRFVKRMHGDTVHYVYADAAVCGCLYVGTQQAYEQYKVDKVAAGYEFFYGPGIGW
jgi:hypothetical protein